MVGEMSNCPKCGEPLDIVSRRNPGVTRFELPAPVLFPGRRNRQEHAVDVPWSSPPAQQPRTVLSGDGETVWRTMSHDADIAPQWELSWRAALPFGVLAALGGACYTWPKLWPVWVPAMVFVSIGGALFWVQNWDMLFPGKDQKHPERLIAHQRKVDDKTQVAGRWETQSTVKAGNTTTIDRPTLANPHTWHRFCKAVVNGREFSESESKRHKVAGEDWRSVYDAWTARGWLIPQGRRKAPRVRGPAMAHIRNYATTPPPDEG